MSSENALEKDPVASNSSSLSATSTPTLGVLVLNPTTSLALSIPSTATATVFSNPQNTLPFLISTTMSAFSNTTTSSVFSNATTTSLFSNTTITSVLNPTSAFSNSTPSFGFSNSANAFTFSKPTNAFTFPNPTTTRFAFSNAASTHVLSNPTFSFSNPFANASTTPNIFNFGATKTTGRLVKNVSSKFRAGESTVCKALDIDTSKEDRPLCVESSTQTETELCVDKLLEGLKEMLLNNKHSDFVLNVKGKQFSVHKIILAAHSPVFAAMIENDTKENATGVAKIDDFEPDTFSGFLNFLYAGKAENLNSDNVFDLYEVADKYQVTELCNLCIKFMINNISMENFCDVLTLSLHHHVKELTEVATQFFLQNSKEIAITVKWGSFMAENPVASNELFLKALNVKNP